MTYSAPSFDFYDDGLVHGHDWSRSTPPGSHHSEFRRSAALGARSTSQDDGHEHGRTRG